MTTDWSGVASTYLDFLKSEDDQLRRELLDPILLNLLKPRGKTILDLGCGEGYFTRVLKAAGATRVVGADISPDLVKSAEEQDVLGEYQIYDIVSAPPFSPPTFDAAVAHMVMMDVSDINAAYQKLSEFLASSGRLIVSIVNPYYAFPVGQWLPATEQPCMGSYSYDLYITNYYGSRVVQKTLGSCTQAVPHFHRQLSDYINVAAKHGLILSALLEPPISPQLHQRFAKLNLAQALARVPLFLILAFHKVPCENGVSADIQDLISLLAQAPTIPPAQPTANVVNAIERFREQAQLKAQHTQLNAQYAQLKAQLDAMQASTSWRLTAPMRWTANWLRARRPS